MAGVLVAIGSAKGSPGVTTLTMALAVSWPTSARRPRPLVVEADPSGGDAAPRFGLSHAPGLMDLAAATRRPAVPRVLGECVQMLPGGIHTVVGPAGAQQAAVAVGMFAANGADLLRAGMGTAGSVLLDLGRLQEQTAGLVAAADRLLLVTRGEVDALSHAAAKVEDLRTVVRAVELVIVGATPYPLSDISAELGVGRVHQVPWDTKTAKALAGSMTLSPRRWPGAPLARAAGLLAEDLNTTRNGTARHETVLIGAPRSGPDHLTAGALGAEETG